jgi:hypothetical protein
MRRILCGFYQDNDVTKVSTRTVVLPNHSHNLLNSSFQKAVDVVAPLTNLKVHQMAQCHCGACSKKGCILVC